MNNMEQKTEVIQVEYDWEVPINFTGISEEVRDGHLWSRTWYKNGLIHRDDGPAVQYGNENQWFVNGLRHREDGPAIEHVNFPYLNSWHLKGRQLKDEADWKQKLKELCWSVLSMINTVNKPGLTQKSH